ncbi:beta-lactamase hydrolase domain-containing protein [Polaromonas sp. CG_9.11]|uniref:beta-lactamase hydrolase domain-containing protein n=1 Tax=Polaromonas sp. CG_9.11 TaxID=2787730 RepID=UPI0018CAF864|nr:sulfur transferase domain-containing protein [Polaromonas sp. CG_9.11]MBG6078012.1 uncharacterized protein (TIGR01244 family) [Polaromonas sp. CG_9.11]
MDEQFKPLENGMLIGPQPSEDNLRQARHEGIKTVIDFRMPGETPTPNAALVERSGLAYVNIPVNKASLSLDQVDELDRAMRDKDGPFLIHCATGARAALLLVLSQARQNGWSAQRAFEEARAMGFDLEKSPEFAEFVKSTTSG